MRVLSIRTNYASRIHADTKSKSIGSTDRRTHECQFVSLYGLYANKARVWRRYSARRCCTNIVNSLNVLHFQVCDEKRKLLNLLEFSGIMEQRLYFSYSGYRKVFGLFAISHCNFTQHYWPIVTEHISPIINPFSQGGE